jgi:hypothetical protein
MKAQTTHYDVLQVARNADAEVIRAAYESLRQTHEAGNSVGPRGEDLALKRLQQAYTVLSDPRSRSRYDARIALWPCVAKGTMTSAFGDAPKRSLAGNKRLLLVFGGGLALVLLIAMYLQLLAFAWESFLIAGPLISPHLLAAAGLFLAVIELGRRFYAGLVEAPPRVQAVRIAQDDLATERRLGRQERWLLAA